MQVIMSILTFKDCHIFRIHMRFCEVFGEELLYFNFQSFTQRQSGYGGVRCIIYFIVLSMLVNSLVINNSV